MLFAIEPVLASIAPPQVDAVPELNIALPIRSKFPVTFKAPLDSIVELYSAPANPVTEDVPKPQFK